MGIGMIVGGILCLMAGLFSGSINLIIVGAISIIFGISDLSRKNKDSNQVNDQLPNRSTDSNSRAGIEAARAYLSRLGTDHHFLMQVQKCVNDEELNKLEKTYGYYFTDDDLKFARTEARSMEPKSSIDTEKKSNDIKGIRANDEREKTDHRFVRENYKSEQGSLGGLKAAREYLVRVKKDHQLRMRVQKCINDAEHLELAKSEGYSFTEDELNEAKEWLKTFE